MEHQHVQILLGLQRLGELPDHLRILQIPSLRHLHHQEMMPDDQEEAVGRRFIQTQSVRYVIGHPLAFAFMTVGLNTFAGIM